MPQVITPKGKIISFNNLVFKNKAMMKRYNYTPYLPDKLKWQGKRMVAAGSLGKQSNGGIYNPGLIKAGDKYVGTLRVEANYLSYNGKLFDTPCQCAYWEFDKDFNSTHHFMLQSPAYTVKTRIEDFRMFEYKGRYLCGHAAIEQPDPTPLQFLSELDLERKELKHLHKFESGNPEKNWGWFVSGNKIMLLYLIAPNWIVFEYKEQTHQLTEVVNMKFHIPWLTDSMASVSSLPVAYGNDFLLWYHSRIEGLYHHSAIIFDGKTFSPKRWYNQPVIHGGHEDGRHSFALYISSCVVEPNRILLFYGEGDSHASVMVIDRADFERLLNEGGNVIM